jgi:AraC-like DNA-binding protein
LNRYNSDSGSFPEPAYFARFPRDEASRIRCDQPRHRMVFDAAYLDLPVLSAAPAAYRTALELCERQLVGYSDAANFTRAFRRWVGKSPRAVRKLT